MAEDLGTWPPEQATVLLEVLHKAGLDPKAKRTREGVAVTVPDDQADEAHRTLVANMDAIARAARSPTQPRGRNRAKGAPPRRGRPTSGPSDGARSPRQLPSLSRPLIILVIGVVLAILVRPLMVPILVFTLAGVIYTLGKQPRSEDD